MTGGEILFIVSYSAPSWVKLVGGGGTSPRPASSRVVGEERCLCFFKAFLALSFDRSFFLRAFICCLMMGAREEWKASASSGRTWMQWGMSEVGRDLPRMMRFAVQHTHTHTHREKGKRYVRRWRSWIVYSLSGQGEPGQSLGPWRPFPEQGSRHACFASLKGRGGKG